ncbi:murein hydrolase activator EnvC [Duganella sp. BJB476]|uniref:murein hydrolase activator EnvC family protein n=1 Tax=Duganella sp. BJB476 TaxID=1871176 RepID=UPI0035A5DE59
MSHSSFRGWRGAATSAALLLLLNGAHAAPFSKTTERSKQKAAAEVERAGLQQKLSALKKDIGKTESAKDDAADTLAESEQAISDANRSLRDLAQEQGDTNTKLQQLAVEHDKLAATVAQQKQQLAKLLRDQYVAGNEDRIKLLLSGDNPNRINRDLQMMSYVSQAQARLLDALRANLKAVEVNQAEAQNAKDELQEIAAEEMEQKARLEQEKTRRANLLASLSKKLVAQRKEAGNVERDEQRLTGLVDKLGKLIQEQAIAAAAEKKRQEQLAVARAKAEAEAKAKADAEARALAKAKAAVEAERQRLAKANAGKSGAIKPAPSKPDTIDADQPKVAQQPPPKPPEPLKPAPREEEPAKAAAKPADIALAPAVPSGAPFVSLKGQLRAPVSGKIAAKFGTKRGDGPSWKGVFIRTGEGAEIRSVASGKVIFSDWLRGFGNMIIVDHGGQYWSIYGNCESLLKRVGDVVKPGDSIASAGNSGGNEESGLYFELRHQGTAFDPAGWVKF